MPSSVYFPCGSFRYLLWKINGCFRTAPRSTRERGENLRFARVNFGRAKKQTKDSTRGEWCQVCSFPQVQYNFPCERKGLKSALWGKRAAFTLCLHSVQGNLGCWGKSPTATLPRNLLVCAKKKPTWRFCKKSETTTCKRRLFGARE